MFFRKIRTEAIYLVEWDTRVFGNLAKKKSLLVYWTGRTFIEVIAPILSDLSGNFKIVIILFNYSLPASAISLLKVLEAEGTIEKYYVTPNYTIGPRYRAIVRDHLYLREIAGELKSYRFDFWLTGSEMQTRERFLLECVLPKHCFSVILWNHITFLFMYNKGIVKKLLAGEHIPEYPIPREVAVSSPQQISSLPAVSIALKIVRGGAIWSKVKKVPRWIGNRIKRQWNSVYSRFLVALDRVVMPRLIAKRTFRLGPYDAITQIGSGRSHMLILFDELEVEAHQKLFPKTEVVVAQYPTVGKCSCDTNKQKKEAILSPLSNFVGMERISDEALALFYRDFNIVLEQTGASYLDLRLHPDESGQWPYQLRDYLLDRGIDARVVNPTLSLHDIVCSYMGIAGSASASLRDCRAACHYALVIGFVGVSKFQFVDPQFAFGHSEGIGWIEEDGSFDLGELKGGRTSPKRKKVSQILYELAERDTPINKEAVI